jgi:hypothetical protein
VIPDEQAVWVTIRKLLSLLVFSKTTQREGIALYFTSEFTIAVVSGNLYEEISSGFHFVSYRWDRASALHESQIAHL